MEKPLASRMRPSSLDEFVGQEKLVGKGKPLRVLIQTGEIPSSIIFWGPPGSGKTTLARLLSKLTNSEFMEYSAVSAGKKDIKKAIERSRLFNKKVILFLDEIHRFNKAQQDFLLPFTEDGTITLIGATTENPSFEINSALLSRSRVFVLERLNEENIQEIIKRVLKSEKGLKENFSLSDENINLIANLSNGDARSALNILEAAASLADKSRTKEITKEIISDSIQRKFLQYDKNGEEHYNIISALHKSMRDSDPDAAVYWTMRMLEAGEDPKYIVRRMMRFASEDVGNADPSALQLAISVKEAVEFLGIPECDSALVQLAAYLAKTKKSNSSYKAVLKAREDIKKTGNLPVPLHLRNAPTKFMKEIGYGKGYKYAHDYKDAKVDQDHLPKELKDKKYYSED